jgi:aryl-alcohol dehydrogenase-like predicted oxidoreductase
MPIEESVGGMAELVKEGKTRSISLSECSAEALKRGSAVHPLVSLQMEYSLFSRDAEEQGQIDACKELGMAMMAYAVLGRGMLSAQMPKVEEMPADDIRAPRFDSINVEKNLRLRSIARGHRAREERHAHPALHRLANGLGLASGSLHHADTWREIAQAP